MAPPETVAIGPISIPRGDVDDVKRGVGSFAMTRTLAFTVLGCCLIITSGFVWAATHMGAGHDELEKQAAINRTTSETLVRIESKVDKIDERVFSIVSGSSPKK